MERWPAYKLADVADLTPRVQLWLLENEPGDSSRTSAERFLKGLR